MDHPPSLSEPESTFALSSHHLSIRHFSAARNYALLAQQNYPTRPEPPQIIAIADVLLAAENRLSNNQLDLYSILQLNKTDPECHIHAEIRTRFKKFLLLLHPSKNRFPLSLEAYMLVCDAWRVLSDPEKKTQYDNEVDENNVKKSKTFWTAGSYCPYKYKFGGETQNKDGVDENNTDQNLKRPATFWTVCPYCYYMFMYNGGYEGFCLRCQNCRKGFHAVATVAPGQGLMVNGKEQYCCVIGCFPLKYCCGGKDSFEGGTDELKNGGDDEKKRFKEGVEGSFEGGTDEVKNGCEDEKKRFKEGVEGMVEGLNERHEESRHERRVKERSVKSDGAGKGKALEENLCVGETRNGMKSVAGRNVKMVARSTKKRLGTGRKMRIEEREGGGEGESCSDDLDFFL